MFLVCWSRMILTMLATHWLQETELLTAGFPCIDVSRAGLRAGLQGKVCKHPSPYFTVGIHVVPED